MYRLCVIPGDGIGREVVPVAVRALQRLLPGLQTIQLEAGWDCFTRHGTSVPQATLEQLREHGAGLFGAVSSPSGAVPGYRSAILTLRQQLDLYLNLRPVRSLPGVSTRDDVDLLLLRENTECLYVGRERMLGDDVTIAERQISRRASERLAACAVALALQRQPRRITLVHKANVLPLTCGLFRDSCRSVLEAAGLSALVDERLVDVAALQLVQEPQNFDMLLTTNLFGDILSDLASHWGGGLGLAPSLNLGDGIALAEPVHGSAPDIAGTGRANPAAALLSAALLLRHHWHLPEQAALLESAVDAALALLAGQSTGTRTTALVEQRVLEHLQRLA